MSLSEINFIQQTLDLIKEQTNLDLELCDYFIGVQETNGKKYFNVILDKRISESQQYDGLKRFADNYDLIDIEPNGLERIAVFPKFI